MNCGAPSRRLVIALGASLLVHYVVAGAWRGGALQSASQSFTQFFIEARLEPSRSAADELPQRGTATSVDSSPVVMHESSIAPQRTRQTVREAQPAIASVQPVLDRRVYLARELDRFPAPVATLSLADVVSGVPAGSVRLWVSIDRNGQVTDIAAVDTLLPAAIDAVVSERLRGTRFSPAYKDERAVNSRVLLEFSQGS